jgi:hypothetical protein
MLAGPTVADLPDFWGIAVVLSVLIFVAVVLTQAGDWYYVPGVFVSFAAVVFWWFATGLDGWAQHGGGVGNSVSARGKPETASFGAFWGVLSTPVEWVYISSLASLICGSFLDVVSVKLSTATGLMAGKKPSLGNGRRLTRRRQSRPRSGPFRIRGTARALRARQSQHHQATRLGSLVRLGHGFFRQTASIGWRDRRGPVSGAPS